MFSDEARKRKEKRRPVSKPFFKKETNFFGDLLSKKNPVREPPIKKRTLFSGTLAEKTETLFSRTPHSNDKYLKH